jgi:hypothetical protein
MARARLFKKTCYYLWRDVKDFAENMILPVLKWTGVIVLGVVLTFTSSYFIIEGLGLDSDDSTHNVVGLFILAAHGFLYWGLCEWTKGAYDKAQMAIHNENQKLMSDVKDPS